MSAARLSKTGPGLMFAGMVLLGVCLYLVSQFWFGLTLATLTVVGVLFTYAFWFVPRLHKAGRFVKRGYVTDVAPHGIVSLELAGTVDRAREIVNSWRDCTTDRHGRKRNVLAEVTAATGRDFGFIVAYVLVLAGAIGWTLDVLGDGWTGWFVVRHAAVAGTLWVLVLAAGLADTVENLFMLRMIAGTVVTDTLPAWTRRLAVLKFCVLALAAAYAVTGLATAIG